MDNHMDMENQVSILVGTLNDPTRFIKKEIPQTVGLKEGDEFDGDELL